MKRSTRVLASAAVAAIALDSTTAPPGQARDFDEPRDGYAPRSTVLRTATPEGVGLLPDPIEQAKALRFALGISPDVQELDEDQQKRLKEIAYEIFGEAKDMYADMKGEETFQT